MNVSVAEAKNKLTELIKKVEDGEEVAIERDGRTGRANRESQTEGKKGSSAS